MPLFPLASDLVLTSALAPCASAAGRASPFADAVAAWHMADTRDAAEPASELAVVGDVSLGLALEGAEREASLARGGDGFAARFEGGYLSAGQGAHGELNLTGKALTMCLRVRDPSGTWDTPLFSKHGGHDQLVYNLFATDLGAGMALGFELGTDWSERPLQLSVPVRLMGPTDWHDVIVRYAGAKLELFVDGVLVDEEWPIGSLRTGNPEPCLLGAESYGGPTKPGFRGLMDHAALWSRALADEEIVLLSGGPEVVAQREREVLGPPGPALQYWRPPGPNAGAGDCMPFYHDGRFHLYYLYDRRHHGSKWGLGAHQWAHASTTDLVHWEHHPLAIPITEEGEGSICTGSVLFHEGLYYGFYATRRPDGTQYLSLATSADGIRFEKQQPNPLVTPPPGYDPMHFRDPKVFRDEEAGLFRMLVTARLTDGRDGCLAQLTSRDLRHWEPSEPFLVPGRVTDCPDYFEWNGWHYLLAESVYWMSPSLHGPWLQPDPDRLDVLYVPKTAEFGENRRLYASWLPDGGWGGDIIFRELVQLGDGRLGTRFVKEMIPAAGRAFPLTFAALTPGAGGDAHRVKLNAENGFAAAALGPVSGDAWVRLRVRPERRAARFALCLRGSGSYEQGCELRFSPLGRTVQLGSPGVQAIGTDVVAAISAVEGLGRPFSLDIITKGDIVDVCVAGRRTIVGRCPVGSGEQLLFAAEHAAVTFESIEVRALREAGDRAPDAGGRTGGHTRPGTGGPQL